MKAAPVGEKIILFGPPAAGKSTLIQLAARRPRTTAIDLERVEKSHRTPFLHVLSLIQFRGALVTAAADVRFEHIPPQFKIVLLLPADRDAYLAQVERRNLSEPRKAGQNEGAIYDSMKKYFRGHSRVALEIDRTDRTETEVVDEIFGKLVAAS